MQKYDYIIAGTGASGLMLAYHMSTNTFFDNKKVLLIDKELKDKNDRTWCFWEKNEGIWDDIVQKKWKYIYFGSKIFSKNIDISPYYYKLIRSKDFYDFVLGHIRSSHNFEIAQEHILGFKDEGTIVEVETDQRKYLGDKVFNSALLPKFEKSNRYPVLNQHFIGWFIKTTSPVFDDSTATFMDFTVDQKGNTRFMYVLPISKTEALFEYTLFSKDLLTDQEYEDEINSYLKEKEIDSYKILEKEKGCIPMTCYPFRKHNSRNVLNIGTAGGWTKPSTGYTFNNTSRKIKELLLFLKTNEDLSSFERKTRFWYYDLLFLDVLYYKNRIGSIIFSKLFQKNHIHQILSFLDEKTSFFEELKLMTSLPSGNFLKMLWKRIF